MLQTVAENYTISFECFIRQSVSQATRKNLEFSLQVSRAYEKLVRVKVILKTTRFLHTKYC